MLSVPSLGFPCGVAPGFDPAHPLAAKCTPLHGFSGVATNGFVNLLTGQAGTVTGAPTSRTLATIGPTQTFGTTDNFQFAGQSTINDAAVTFAAIVQVPGVITGNASFLRTSNATSGIELIATSVALQINGPGSAGASAAALSLTANIPYFVAASQGPGFVCYVLRNLATGQLYTSVGGTAATTLAPNGTYRVGNNAQGNIAAAMVSFQTASLGQLMQAAADPWGFWYK